MAANCHVTAPNTSSVHLRDLDNLVSAFTDKHPSAFHMKDRPDSATRLQVLNGVTRDEYDTNDVFTRASKIHSPTMPPMMISKIQHETGILAKSKFLVSTNALNELHFEEQVFNGTAGNQAQITDGISLDSSSVIEPDLSETQHTMDSLHLISELCDRLYSPTDFTATETISFPGSRKRRDHEVATETGFEDTPSTPAVQRLNPNNQAVLSTSSCCAAAPQSVSTLQITSADWLKIPARFGSSQSHNGNCSHNYHAITPSRNHDATETSNEELLDQRHELLGACPEPNGAISYMEQMLERFPPREMRSKPCEPDIGDVLKSSDVTGR